MDNNPDLAIVDKSPSKQDNIFNPKKSNTFWVLLKDKANEVPTYKKQLASDYLYRISLSTGKEQLIKCFFELNDSFLFCYKVRRAHQESTKVLVAYLDLEYAKIKEITQVMNNTTYYGIRIIKAKNYEDVLSEDEKLIQKWFELFKRYCILSQFGMAYENVKVLGQGNFAKVFLVKRKSDGHMLAAKVFDKKAISSDEMEKKCLIYEVNTLRSLENPNLIQLVELYEGQNYVYCVTEAYMGGHLLQKILKKPNGRFSEKDSLEIMYRILRALSYLEARDVIHRDLKPENIIFRNNEDPYEVVIVDFGFATKVEDYKNLFTRCGTPGYVAPEVLNDFPYNTKADVFSAGIIFYILYTLLTQTHRLRPLLRRRLRRRGRQEPQGRPELQLRRNRPQVRPRHHGPAQVAAEENAQVEDIRIRSTQPLGLQSDPVDAGRRRRPDPGELGHPEPQRVPREVRLAHAGTSSTSRSSPKSRTRSPTTSQTSTPRCLPLTTESSSRSSPWPEPTPASPRCSWAERSIKTLQQKRLSTTSSKSPTCAKSEKSEKKLKPPKQGTRRRRTAKQLLPRTR